MRSIPKYFYEGQKVQWLEGLKGRHISIAFGTIAAIDKNRKWLIIVWDPSTKPAFLPDASFWYARRLLNLRPL